MSNNHLTSYIEQNPGISLDLTEVYTLRAFTQFEIRSLEQALLSHFSPVLNGTYTVVFPFVRWQAGDVITDQGSMALVVKSVDGKLNLNYASKSKAAIALGIPKTTLDRYTNLRGFPVYSPILGTEVLLIDESRPLSDDAPVFSSESSIPTISGVNLTDLEKGKLYALCMDKKTIYGVYTNSREAAITLDGRSDSRYISRYINKEYPITVSEDQEPVFFVMHPEWLEDTKGRIGVRAPGRKRSGLSKSIVLVDTLNNTALSFETVSDLSAFLGRKSFTDTNYVKKYMYPTKLYKNQYEFYYEEDFKGTITGQGPKRN